MPDTEFGREAQDDTEFGREASRLGSGAGRGSDLRGWVGARSLWVEFRCRALALRPLHGLSARGLRLQSGAGPCIAIRDSGQKSRSVKRTLSEATIA